MRAPSYNKNEILVISMFLLLPWILCYCSTNMILGDNVRAAYPAFQLTIQKILSGSSILWNEYTLAGHPFLAEIVNGVLYPPKLFLYLILPIKWAYNVTILLHFSLAGWFTYLYLRCIHISRFTAFFGGLILMLSPIYRIQILDSISLLHTITWFPLIMYLVEKRITSGKKKFLLYAACTFVIQILAGFTQDSFYTAMAVIIYSALRYYNKYQRVTSAFKNFSYDMVLFGLIVISFSSVQLLPTIELLSVTQHYQLGWNLIEQFSAPPLGFLTFINPFIWGGFENGVGIQSFYFLSTFTGNNYLGIVTLLFAIYSLKLWISNNLIRIWSVLLLISLTVALGVHIMPVAKFLFNFPLTHEFRFHTRIYFISVLAIVVLFSFGLEEILKLDHKSMRHAMNKILKFGLLLEIFIFFLICGLILGIDLFKNFTNTINNQNYDKLIQYYQFENIALFKPFIIFLCVAILLSVLPFFRKKIFIMSLLVLLTTIELFDISSGFTKNQNISLPHTNTLLKVKTLLKPAERMVLVQDSGWQDASNMLHKIESLNGFVSFDERIIGSFRAGISSLADLSSSKSFFIEQLHHKNDFLSMLGLTYFIIPRSSEEEIKKPYLTNLRQWQLLSKIAPEDMTKYNSPELKILSKKIHIEPNTYYKINLRLNKIITKWLYVDFYGTNYNNPKQHLAFINEGSISKKRNFQGVINSGKNVPQDTYLRIVTNDNILSIDNIEVYSSPAAISNTSIYKKICSINDDTIYKNLNAKPRVYSINNVKGEEDISYDDIDLSTTAVLNKNFKEMPGLGIAAVKKLIYSAGNVNTELNCPTDKCLVILSESYFPGWKAFVDGKENNLYKVNDLIMGTFINRGEHWVRFYYLPNSIIIGLCLFIFGLIWVPIWILKKPRS